MNISDRKIVMGVQQIAVKISFLKHEIKYASKCLVSLMFDEIASPLFSKTALL